MAEVSVDSVGEDEGWEEQENVEGVDVELEAVADETQAGTLICRWRCGEALAGGSGGLVRFGQQKNTMGMKGWFSLWKP